MEHATDHLNSLDSFIDPIACTNSFMFPSILANTQIPIFVTPPDTTTVNLPQTTYASFNSPNSMSSVLYPTPSSNSSHCNTVSPHSSIKNEFDDEISSRISRHSSASEPDEDNQEKSEFKPKRDNRYKNASPSVISRRRAQNRTSQRAYRERKDQRIRDLEAELEKAKQLIASLSQSLTLHQTQLSQSQVQTHTNTNTNTNTQPQNPQPQVQQQKDYFTHTSTSASPILGMVDVTHGAFPSAQMTSGLLGLTAAGRSRAASMGQLTGSRMGVNLRVPVATSSPQMSIANAWGLYDNVGYQQM